MKINIAGGRGIMGHVHKPVFEKAGHEVIISGRNSSPSLEEAANMSDLTIVSVPIDVTESTIKKIGPYCKAIMDFTSVKCMPIDWMLKYTDETCEVGGLHPLYGSVNSIKDRTIVYCSTERSDDRCETILDALKISGGKIYPMDAEQHDHVVNGILQSNRIKLFEAFIFSLSEAGLSFKDVYQLSSMPGRALLDLIARQADERNDGLYESMRDFNPFEDDLNHELTFCLKDAIEDYNPEKIRAFFGEDLKAAQERAKKLLS